MTKPEASSPYAIAVTALSRRALTRAELSARLSRAGVSAKDRTETIAELESRGYLPPDGVIVRSWAESLSRRKGYGPARLEREIARRGIPADAARVVASEIVHSGNLDGLLGRELERAIRTVKKSPSSRGEETRRPRAGRRSISPSGSRSARIFERLRRKGFPPAAIRAAMKASGLFAPIDAEEGEPT